MWNRVLAPHDSRREAPRPGGRILRTPSDAGRITWTCDALLRWLEAHGQLASADTVRRDWDSFVAFYDFPAEHWIHLRTSNPIESLFAGVRLRTDVAKHMRRRENPLYLVFKIAQRLEHSWRPLNGGLTIMTLLLGGARFVHGVYVLADFERPGDPGEEVSAA